MLSSVEAIEVHIAGLRVDVERLPEEIGTPQLLAVTVAACRLVDDDGAVVLQQPRTTNGLRTRSDRHLLIIEFRSATTRACAI